MHLDDKLLNAQSAGREAVAKLQADLEERVRKDLDQLTIIANNKYAGGRHMYDYKLVKLSPREIAAEKKAVERADAIYKRHNQLSKSEQEMENRFEKTKHRLEDYRDQFYKARSSLQQDHDSFVKIREKESRELDEQLAIQKEIEVQTNEALQQKADMQLNVTTSD